VKLNSCICRPKKANKNSRSLILKLNNRSQSPLRKRAISLKIYNHLKQVFFLIHIFIENKNAKLGNKNIDKKQKKNQ
jgi:hypothetical protein